MNITELKALAEKATPGPWKAGSATVTGDETDDSPSLDAKLYGGNGQAKARNARFIAAANPAAIQELIAQLEDAQGEIRALLVNEQNLRERVKALEEGIKDAAVLADFAEIWITDPAIEGMRRLEGGGDKFRALLEQQK